MGMGYNEKKSFSLFGHNNVHAQTAIILSIYMFLVSLVLLCYIVDVLFFVFVCFPFQENTKFLYKTLNFFCLLYQNKLALAPTFAALIPARRRSRLPAPLRVATPSSSFKKKNIRPCRESNMHTENFRFKVHRLIHSATEAALPLI